MKNFTTAVLAIFLLTLLITFTVPVSAQEINSPTVIAPVSNDEGTGGAVVTEYDVYLGDEAPAEVESESVGETRMDLDFSGQQVPPEVQSAMSNLEVKSAEIFSSEFPEVKDLLVNPAIEDGKVLYDIELKEGETLDPRQQLTNQPLFDLRVDQPIEFDLVDNRIIVNDEQIIDYTGLVNTENEDGTIIIGNISIQSAIQDGKVYDLSLVIDNMQHKEREHVSFYWMPDTAVTDNENIQDWEVREGYSMPIYSDFKVEDKKLYLLHNEEVHDLKILPPEIYSAVHDLRVEEPKIVFKDFSLKIENEKPIYDLRVEQPAKILWLIPWTVESEYVIDPADGSAELVGSPWYITSEKLGSNMGFKLNKSYTWA